MKKKKTTRDLLVFLGVLFVLVALATPDGSIAPNDSDPFITPYLESVVTETYTFEILFGTIYSPVEGYTNCEGLKINSLIPLIVIEVIEFSVSPRYKKNLYDFEFESDSFLTVIRISFLPNESAIPSPKSPVIFALLESLANDGIISILVVSRSIYIRS